MLPACACCGRCAHASRGCARSHIVRFAAYGALGAGGLILGGSAAGIIAAIVAAQVRSQTWVTQLTAPPAYLLFSVFAAAWALAGFSALCLAAICFDFATLRGEAAPFASEAAPPVRAPVAPAPAVLAAAASPRSQPAPFGLSVYKASNPFGAEPPQPPSLLADSFGQAGNPFSVSAPSASDPASEPSMGGRGSSINPFTA